MSEPDRQILLIEDNPSDAFLFGELLKGIGGKPSLSVSQRLSDGLALAGRQQFCVVFVDLGLPDSKGLETVQRAVAVFRDVPVVVLTGLEDEQVGLDSLRAGAQDYLVKGQISSGAIARALRYAIERHRILLDLHTARDHLEEKVQQRTGELTRALDELQNEIHLRLQEQEQRRRAEAEVLQAVETEQRRIGRDLHDGIQGNLAGMKMMLAMLKKKAQAAAPGLAGGIDELTQVADQTLQQIRGLARNLCPVDLSHNGLFYALEKLASTTDSVFHTPCQFVGDKDVHFPDERIASHLYYISYEAVNNALKHARAKNILIRLANGDSRMSLTVEDDGIGLPKDRRPTGGMGLRTMEYRASLIGAKLSILPGRKGGTRIECLLPDPSAGR
jgi:signal transduction histidine kinase